jgi:hypothetical protein
MCKKLILLAFILMGILGYLDYRQVKNNNDKSVLSNPNYKPVHMPKEMFVGYPNNNDISDYKKNVVALETAVILNHYRRGND